MNDLKLIVACNGDGDIMSDNIFGYRDLFKEKEFIESVRECLGIMPSDMANRVMNIGMLICKDITSSGDDMMLVSMVRAMEGRDVGRVCVFADKELFDQMVAGGVASTYICVYPSNANEPPKFDASFTVLESSRYGKWNVEKRQRTATWNDEDIQDAINELETMMNRDGDEPTDPFDQATEELRNDAKFEDFIQKLENRDSLDEEDDEEFPELSVDDIASIVAHDEQCAVQDSYASISLVKQVADLLNQTVTAVNKLNSQVTVIIGLVNNHISRTKQMFDILGKNLADSEANMQLQSQMYESNIKDVRQQIANIIRDGQRSKYVPVLLSILAVIISIVSVVIN